MEQEHTNEGSETDVQAVRPRMDSEKIGCRSMPFVQEREMEHYRRIYEEIGRAVWHYYRHRSKAHVAAAIKYGSLEHPAKLACHECGFPATVYEHRDYAKPLDVQPTCDKCNRALGPGNLDVDHVIDAIRRSETTKTLSQRDEHSDLFAFLGKRGGSVKSAAKLAAARENGKKGGRPKWKNKPASGANQ